MIKNFSIFLVLLICYANAFAADYKLPGDVGSNPFNCTGSESPFTCNNSITIPESSTFTLNSDITLEIMGDFTLQKDFKGVTTSGYQLTLIVHGDVIINENAAFSGNISATGNVTIEKQSKITGNFDAGGEIIINENSEVKGNLDAGGDITIAKQSKITGDFDAAGKIIINENSEVKGNLDAVGNITIEKQSKIVGNLGAGGEIKIKENSNIEGNLDAFDDITIDKQSKIVGDVTAGDNLDLKENTVVDGICSPTHNQCTVPNVSPPSGCDTFADNFNSTLYSNQDGTEEWSSDWSETNDDGSPEEGEIKISETHLRIENSDRVITRNADLSEYSTATLTFYYHESKFDENSDFIEIQVRGGVNGWTSLQKFAGSNVGSGRASLPILSSFLDSNFQIRFITSNSLGNNDRFYVDNLQIDACPAASQPPAIDFHFDEVSWTGVSGEVIDSSLNAAHASISPTSGLNTIANGAVCRAGHFDGNNDYIVSNDIYALLKTTASMSFWIKTTQTGNDTYWLAPGVAGIQKAQSGDDIFWGWLDASGHIGISKGNTSSEMSSDAINNGTYHHIVLTRDSPTGTYKIYIDGVLNVSGTTGAGDVGTSFSSIGRIEDTDGSPEYLQGDLDEIMVFDSVLSDAAVSAIYTNQLAGNNYDGTSRGCELSLPLAEWRLDERAWSGTAGEVVDSSGNGLNGTTLDGVNSIPAKICNGMDVSANTSDTEQYGFDSNVDIDDDVGNVGSISLWYRSNKAWKDGGDRAIFDASADDLTDPDHYFTLMLNNSGALGFNVEDYQDGDYQFATEPKTFEAGEWVHIIVTWDMYGSRQIYINGNLSTTDSSVPKKQIGKLRTLYLGDNRSSYHPVGVGTPNSANGVIDEVIIFNQVISGADVTNIYTNQLAGKNYDGTTRTCAVTEPDHYEISHSKQGITCAPEMVTVTAHNADHSLFSVLADTSLTVSTTPEVDAITSSPVTISAGQSSVTFTITETTITTEPHVNINVTDGTATETSGSATAADDPVLAFVDSLFQFVTDTNTPPATIINTQIGGKPSSTAPNDQNIYLRAVKTDDTTGSPVCVAALEAGEHAINMGYQCIDTNSCSSNELSVKNALSYNSDAIAATLSYNNGATTGDTSAVTLEFDNNAYAPLSFLYNNVGKISIFAGAYTMVSEGTIGSGISNQFIVRPFGLRLDFDDGSSTYNLRQQDWSDGVLDGTVGNVSYSDPSTNPQNSKVFQTAGSDFPAEITAVLWQAGDDSNNNGEPDAGANLYDNDVASLFGQEEGAFTTQFSHSLEQPSGGNAGELSSSFTNDYENGRTKGSMSWSEVGILDIDLALSSYLGDTTYISSYTIEDVGRFRPAGFRIQADSANNGVFSNSCGAFSYIGQNFGYLVNPAFVVEAINTASAVTTNYRGDWNKLTSGSFPISVVSKDGSNALDIMHTQAGINYNPVGNGVFNVALGADTFCYGLNVLGSCVKQSNAQLAPFTATITMSLATISDGEVLTAIGRDFSPTLGQLRFGRLAMDNVFGSELIGLTMPMRTQHFNGSNFIPNVGDGCTTINNIANELTVTPVLSGGASIVAVISTIAAVGILDISLTAPGAGNTGFIDVVPNLTISGEPWLQFDWDGDGNHDNNPTGRANFGIYNGDPWQIYIRQN